MHIYTAVCKADSSWEAADAGQGAQLSWLCVTRGWDGEGGSRGGGIWAHTADSLCCTAETTTVEQLCSTKRINKFFF